MTRRLIILAPVERELADAVAWYEERQAGLGVQLVHELDATIVRIAANPESYQRLAGTGVRQAVLHRFPYVVLYELGPVGIRILALAHGRQRPGAWRGRRR